MIFADTIPTYKTFAIRLLYMHIKCYLQLMCLYKILFAGVVSTYKILFAGIVSTYKNLFAVIVSTVVMYPLQSVVINPSLTMAFFLENKCAGIHTSLRTNRENNCKNLEIVTTSKKKEICNII